MLTDEERLKNQLIMPVVQLAELSNYCLNNVGHVLLVIIMSTILLGSYKVRHFAFADLCISAFWYIKKIVIGAMLYYSLARLTYYH